MLADHLSGLLVHMLALLLLVLCLFPLGFLAMLLICLAHDLRRRPWRLAYAFYGLTSWISLACLLGCPTALQGGSATLVVTLGGWRSWTHYRASQSPTEEPPPVVLWD